MPGAEQVRMTAAPDACPMCGASWWPEDLDAGDAEVVVRMCSSGDAFILQPGLFIGPIGVEHVALRRVR